MQYFPALLPAEDSNALVDLIQSHLEEHGWGLWAVEVRSTGAFAGFIGLTRPRIDAHFTPCVEVGWRLGSVYWGHGYATEGATAALAFGFGTLGLPEIVSLTTESNARSRRVMERVGMVHDSADDFEHPGMPPGHPLRRHVLYRKSAAA
jgi:ribosomal-protein-alanine N-acetyltransferase